MSHGFPLAMGSFGAGASRLRTRLQMASFGAWDLLTALRYSPAGLLAGRYKDGKEPSVITRRPLDSRGGK
jgi:hypothetical protein